MRKLLTILLLCCSTVVMGSTSLFTVPGSAILTTIARNEPWPGSNSYRYLITSPSVNLGLCVFITNNNPTNARTFFISTLGTADKTFVDTGFNTLLSGFNGGSLAGSTLTAVTIPASFTASWFFSTMGAVKIVMGIFSSSGTAGGSPDTFTAIAAFSAGCPSGGNSGSSPTGAGAQTVGPNQWSITAAPSLSAQASVANAGATGVRHTATCFDVSIVANTTTACTPVDAVVRDGVCGSSTIIWRHAMGAPAGAGNHGDEELCGLQLIGTPGNAMCVEFTAAVAGCWERVNLSGFDQ